MAIQLQKPDYIIIYVSDMQRSTAFYRDVLGLPLKFTSPGWTEFATGTTTVALHMTGDAKLPPCRPSTGGTGAYRFYRGRHFSGLRVIEIPGCHFSLPPQKQTSGVTLAVLHDPDGLGITITSNASGSKRNMLNNPGVDGARFAFLDAGETARRLGIDRVTLDQWVRDGRLKAYKGVGRDFFFQVGGYRCALQ